MKRSLAVLLLAALPWTAAAQDRTIVKTATVKATVDEVWNAWTTSEGIKSFFAPDARVDPRPGGAFEIHFNPYARPGLKGADGMTVLAVQDKRMFSFTWNSPPHLAEVRPQRTAVTVRLKPAGEGLTDVRITHSGWGDGGQWDQSFEYFSGAWGRILANLERRFTDGPIDWAPFLQQVKAYQDAEDARQAQAGDRKKP